MKVLLLLSLLALGTLAQDYAEEVVDSTEYETPEDLAEEPKKRVQRPRKPQPDNEKVDTKKKSYACEYVTGAFLVVYFAYFFVGKRTNTSVVTS